jgi:hypothetical protein
MAVEALGIKVGTPLIEWLTKFSLPSKLTAEGLRAGYRV